MIEDCFNFLWSYKLLLSRIDAKDMRNRFQSSLSVSNIFYSPISKFTLDNNMPYLIYLPILDGDNLIQSIWMASCKESSKLVVLTNNYSPDYAPFTVDKKGTLEKVPVQIRVGFQILRMLFSKISFSDWLDQDPGYQWSWSNIWQPIQPLHDLVMKYSCHKSTN